MKNINAITVMNDATKGPWTYDEVWALIKGPKGEEIAAIHSGQGLIDPSLGTTPR